MAHAAGRMLTLTQRSALAEQVRNAHARLAHALNRNNPTDIGMCLTRTAVLTHQAKGGRPTKVRGQAEVVRFLQGDRAAQEAAGTRDLRYSFPDVEVEVTSQVGSVRATSQFFVYSVPQGGMYGGIVESGEVEDLYEYAPGDDGWRLASRHIRTDTAAEDAPTATSA